MSVPRKRQPIVKEFVEPIKETITTKSNMFPIEGIPTDYKLYPENTQIFGRPLTVKEVKLLAGMNETNFTFIINEILQNATSGIEIDELYVADKLYILFWLRANTYKNEGYSTEFVCSHCGAKNSYLFTMDKLKIISLSEKEFDPDQEIELLNVSDKIKINFPKVKDENQVTQMLKANKNSSIKLDEDILSMAVMIKTINGEEMSLRYVYEYLNNLSVEDFAFIKSHLEDLDIGVSSDIPVFCSNTSCQEENLIEVRFHSEFFLPKYQHRANS
jgi:hypothetical protein